MSVHNDHKHTKHFQELAHHSTCVTIQNLPNEILEFIFSFLSIKERFRIEFVCRRWREIGKSVTWSWPTELNLSQLREVDLKNIPLTDKILSNVLSRCGLTVKRLVLDQADKLLLHVVDQLTCRVLDIIAESCPNLTEMKLKLCELSHEDIFAGCLLNLAKHCTKLKKVSLMSAYGMDDAALSRFLHECQSLEHLALKNSYKITDKCVDALNKNLKGFYFGGIDEASNYDILVEKLINKCDGIEELDPGHLQLDKLMKLLRHYQNTLKTLFLSKYVMTPHEWYEMLDVLQNVEVLVMPGAVGVDDTVMMVLAEKCKKLKALNISSTDVSDVGVSFLASLPSLIALDVSWLGISGEGLKHVASKGNLVRVYLRYIGGLEGNLIEEQSIISIAKFCPNIRLLGMCGNSTITDRLVEEFILSLESGFLKGPISLYIEKTKVSRNVSSNHQLKLLRTLAPHPDFHDLFYDYDEEL